MPRLRSSMRQIREVLRQKWELGFSVRRIARSCGLSRPAVSNYVRRAEASGLSWPLPASLDDTQLERRLFPPLPPSPVPRPEPDWAAVHRKLKRKGVTPQLLWDEYKAAHPNGYQYSTFCLHFRRWRNRLDVVILAHDDVQFAPPGAVLLAEPAVLVAVGMGLPILLPKQKQRDALALELPVNLDPVRNAPRLGGQIRRRRKQQPLQTGVAQIRRQGPAQPRRFGPPADIRSPSDGLCRN